MKKLVALILCACVMASCATITNKGPVTASQKKKPGPGEPQREIRVGAFIGDLLLFVWPLAIDFGTGAIWKKAPGEQPVKKAP